MAALPDDEVHLVNPRWVVAERMADRARRGHPADVLAIGVTGSLAHGDDVDTSDVNLIVITYRPDAGPRPDARRVDGILVDVAVAGAEACLRRARTLSATWPLTADRFVTAKPIHDPTGWLDHLRDVHLGRLAEAGAREFSSLARQAWCRAATTHERATRLAGWYETDAALLLLGEARLAAAIVVGLLTRTYFRNSADAVRRTGLAGIDLAELGSLLREQAEELARRGWPVDGSPADVFG